MNDIELTNSKLYCSQLLIDLFNNEYNLDLHEVNLGTCIVLNSKNKAIIKMTKSINIEIKGIEC